ncbi:MAG: hypothetical protein IJW54_06410 [Clostridia bacterium]|nr:hypothetical protein [Clostridia bacterium]
MKTKKIANNRISFLENEVKEVKVENDESELLSTLDSVLLLDTKKKIELSAYFDSTLNLLLDDSRFAYRIFRLVSFENNYIFSNTDHLTIINLAILSLINDYEYKNPIDIIIEKGSEGFKISYEVIVKKKPSNLIKQSDKEIYISCLCNQDGNSYNIAILENKLTLELNLIEEIQKEKELSCDTFGESEKELVSKYLDIFFKTKNTEEVEQVEEEE